MSQRCLLLMVLGTAMAAMPPGAQGQEIRVMSRGQRVVEHENCAASGTCSLKRVRFFVENYSVLVQDEPSYGTRLYAEYETDSVEALEDYVFVQFLRGCIYETRVESGMVVPHYGNVR